MSVNSIVDLHRNLKKAAAGAAKAANARNEKAKGYLNDIRNMETRLQEIRERKQAKLQENTQSEAPVKEPVEKAAPVEIKVPETKPEPLKVPEKEPVKAEATKAEERPAEEKKEQAPVQEAPEKLEKKAEKKPAEKKEAPKKETGSVSPAVKTEKQPEKKEAPQKKEAPEKKRPTISVYTPDLTYKPAIRVVRSAKAEEEVQKQRQERAREAKAQNESRAKAVQNETRNRGEKRFDRDRKNENRPPKNERRNDRAAEFDKDKDEDENTNQRKAPQKTQKKTVFIAPQVRDRQHAAHDSKKHMSEEEMAAKRRRTAMKERATFTDDDDIERNSRRAKKKDQKKSQQVMEAIKIENATVTGDNVSIKELAEKIGKPAADIIKKLFMLGNICTINSEIDFDTAALIADDYGVTLEQIHEQTAEDTLLAEFEDEKDDDENLIIRPPVVTVMGHVDHGKTSLLDAIRETKVQEGEAGGITQHIGAYTVSIKGRQITFLDTPGHAAFTAMRARGAQATDIAVLVVAADDGVMPQTVEAINHAKAAGVPIIVAVNKMDKPAANPERVKQELTEYGLVAEEWGGDTIIAPVSAVTHEGIDNLLEMILLVADVQELKANPNRMAKGIIIEARLDKGRGPVATVLVQNGTLHVQDTIVAGMAYGRVRALNDDTGRSVESAGPSMPVEVIGFNEVPDAGDIIYAVEQDKLSRQVVEERKDRLKAEKTKSMARVSLDDLFSKIAEGQMKELNIIVKADVQGSVEAIRQSLEKLSNDEVRVRVIHGAVGAISENDILLASTSNAIVIGFNVRPEAAANAQAEKDGVDVRLYRIIYNAIEDVEKAMKGLLEPTFKEEILGHATVRQIFKVSSVGTIAGSYVTDGKLVRNAGVRLVRNGIVVYEGKMSSLKRFKDDAREVTSGYECGVTLENYNDIKEDDVIEAYQEVEVKND